MTFGEVMSVVTYLASVAYVAGAVMYLLKESFLGWGQKR